MYCSRCGTQYDAIPNFCRACGQAVAGWTPAAAAERFQSLRHLASPMLVAFAVVIGFDLVLAILDVERISLGYRLLAGRSYAQAEAGLTGMAYDLASLLYLFPFLVASIFFVVWTYRASRNLVPLGSRGQRYSPGWAAGWFFIPLANMVMPYLVIREIWKGSDPGCRDGESWRHGAAPAFLPVWWVLIVITRLLSVPSLMMILDDSATGRLYEGWIGLADNLLEIAIAALFIVLVRRLTARQEEKARAGSGEPGLSPISA